MIRLRSRPFCTIMSGFGFRMTLRLSLRSRRSWRCSVHGSVHSTLSCGRVWRSLGPRVWPRSSLFARLVHNLTVLVSTVVSVWATELFRIWRPNLPFPRANHLCGCLHLISFRKRPTCSRNTRRHGRRSHTFAWTKRRMSESVYMYSYGVYIYIYMIV